MISIENYLYKTDTFARPKGCPSWEVLLYCVFYLICTNICFAGSKSMGRSSSSLSAEEFCLECLALPFISFQSYSIEQLCSFPFSLCWSLLCFSFLSLFVFSPSLISLPYVPPVNLPDIARLTQGNSKEDRRRRSLPNYRYILYGAYVLSLWPT